MALGLPRCRTSSTRSARQGYSLQTSCLPMRRWVVAKYLIKASYTPEGAKGLLKDGGSKRRAAAEQALKSAGGKLEVFYFAFGDTDAYVIVDAPDHAAVSAASLVIN